MGVVVLNFSLFSVGGPREVLEVLVAEEQGEGAGLVDLHSFTKIPQRGLFQRLNSMGNASDPALLVLLRRTIRMTSTLPSQCARFRQVRRPP